MTLLHANKTLRSLGAGAWLAILSAGCGGGLETVPVWGRVTFDGGPCPAPGVVQFLPLEPAEGFPRRHGGGSFDASGRFTATSFSTGDGLVPGRYRVLLECWRTPPGEDSPGESYVPADYAPPELTVDRGQRAIELNYDIPFTTAAH